MQTIVKEKAAKFENMQRLGEIQNKKNGAH